MDYKQEQQDEKESIQLIYADHYEDLGENKLKITMFPFAVENEDEDEVNHVGVTLQIIFPETYPDVIPEINIFNLKNLNNQLCGELREKLEVLAQDYIGSQMVYNLASAAQEWLLEKNDERTENEKEDEEGEDAEAKMSAYERMMLDRQREQQELQKMNRYTLDSALGKGTPVTHENFKEWKLRFDEERRQVQELLMKQNLTKQVKETNENRLTGREWFEQKSKWFSGEEEEEEPEVDIDNDLFLDDGDDDDEEEDEEDDE